MSIKTKALKAMRKEIRNARDKISERLIIELLALPFWTRVRVAMVMIFRKKSKRTF